MLVYICGMNYKDAVLYYNEKTGDYTWNFFDGVFGMFTPAYTVSNEILNSAMKLLKPEEKSVLTVAGSGDQAFFLKIYGASHVDTFDISYCAKVMMDVKTAAVQNLQCDEYKKFLDSIGPAVVNIPGLPEYKKISSGLSDETKDFLDVMRGRKFRYDSCYNFNLPTVKQYKKLQDSIDKPFNFIWSDVMNVAGALTRKYDQIYLSNIFQYNCDVDKTVKLMTDLLPVLNDGGKIMFYVTPWLQDEELCVLGKVEEKLNKFIKIHYARGFMQHHVVVKKL